MNNDARPADTSSPCPPLAVRERGAAKLLGVSAKTIQNWTRDGVIPSHRIGGCRLYIIAELQRWADDLAAKPPEPKGGADHA